VTIAIPISQERISPLLDAAARLLLVTRRRGKEVARKEFILGPLSPEELARSVAELRVDVLLCAALSQGLHRALERRGVLVQPHLCGDTEAVLQAFCCDQLNRPEFRMPGCWGQHLAANCCRRHRAARLVKTFFKPTKTSKT
jgi:predicted Fe-Mo cluster-binding NifX family protein